MQNEREFNKKSQAKGNIWIYTLITIINLTIDIQVARLEAERDRLQAQLRLVEQRESTLADEAAKKKHQDNEKRNRMSVGSDINPISIDPVVNKKPKNNDNPFTSQNDKDDDVTEEDIDEEYSEHFSDASDKFDKKLISDLEESKKTERPPINKSAGQNLIQKYGDHNFDDTINDSGTLDWNLSQTATLQESIPFPKGGNLAKSTSKHQNKDQDRAAKIERLTKGKDPFSSYVRELPDDEDEIPDSYV